MNNAALHINRAVFVAAGVVMGALAVQVATAQLKVQEVRIFVDYDDVPHTLADHVAKADAIVRVVVEGKRFDWHERADDVTGYELRVIEVLKRFSTLPQDRLLITTRGGEHLEGDTLVRSVVGGFEMGLQQRSEYLLFLAWNERTFEFDLSYLPYGVFHLAADGRIFPPAPYDQGGRSTEALLAAVRAAIPR
jgi:hypothetical protein